MLNVLVNSGLFLKKITLSAIVLLLATTSFALPKIGRPGCPWSYPGSNEVIYIECSYCPDLPRNLGCTPTCTSACLDAFTYQETFDGSGIYLIEIYSDDGIVVGSFYADGWEDETITLPGGIQGIKTTFKIVHP